jgi:hypothetical protein
MAALINRRAPIKPIHKSNIIGSTTSTAW